MARHVAALALLVAMPAWAQSVTTYHNNVNRHGEYAVPGLTATTAAAMHADPNFHASVSGNVYAQPLYWAATGTTARIIVATESNQVQALNATTGVQIWSRALPASAPSSALQCGDINPEGITGTPAIDPASGTIYLDAVTGTTHATVRHMLYALSADSGAVLPGYPLDIQAALAARGVAFDSTDQGERGAVLVLNGAVYVTYGGRAGDCGAYHGMVVQVAPSATPSVAGVWATRATRGGIWAQSGAASDAFAIYVTTGNTDSPATWMDGEAVIRLRSGLAAPSKTTDYYAPANWQALDNADADLGGTEAIPFAAPAGAGPRLIAFGKDGNAYLLDRRNLGGIGGALAVTHVSNSEIITAPAVYNTSGSALVAFRNGNGLTCSGSSISMLNVTSGATPIKEVWCAALNGAGAPIITTSNGSADPLVWVTGAEGDNLLHGFDATTGRAVFSGGAMRGLHRFSSLIAANHRLYVGADNTVYAFTFQ